MEKQTHPLSELFKQLGLPADSDSIDRFCAEHAPLDPEIKLAAAPFWTPAQASFLQEAFLLDADWVEVVDHLDARLRKPRPLN